MSDTADHARSIRYLSRLCVRWGGTLALLSEEEYTILREEREIGRAHV